MSARRARARTTIGVAILLGLAWWTGRAIGQHRRARRQMGVLPGRFTYTIRPTDQELTA